MNSNQKKILLAFSTDANKGLMKEVLTQMDRKLRIDFASNETDVLYYLSRHRNKVLPGLIIFDGPPVRPGLAELIDNIHKDNYLKDIPVAVLVPHGDIPTMKKWVRSEPVHFFPLPALPSECKMYVRQILGLYKESKLADVEL